MSMSNENLFALYKKHYRLIYKICGRVCLKGYDMSDIIQEAYFPFAEAVKDYDTEKGMKLSVYIAYRVKWYFGVKMRSDNRLKELCVLDTPIDEDKTVTKCDTIEDEKASFLEGLTESIDNERLFDVVKTILDKWEKDHNSKQNLFETVKQRAEGKTYREISENMSVSFERVCQRAQRAYRILRLKQNALYLTTYDAVIDASYKKSALSYFKNTHLSSTEWAVIKRQK